MRHLLLLLGCGSSFFAQTPAAVAQIATVQEPSFETFGVATTVSVPDRGRMTLGGVGRSAASRSVYGPFRSGTNMGLSTQGTGLSVQAHVHDLAEMDRAVLDAAGKSRMARDSIRLSDSAEHAYETLRNRRPVRDVAKAAPGALGATAPIKETATPAAAQGPSTARLLDRARQAEAGGKRELALAFLRVARDQGSSDAQNEIERLTRKKR